MLTLSRRQMTVLFLVLVSFIVTLIASMAILHAVDPALWHHISDILPDTNSHY